MVQYFIAVNKTKKEYFTPWELGGVAKLWEWCVNPQAGVLPFLLRKSNATGGGDVYYRVPEPQYAGRWAGDKVYLVGDYDPGAHSAVNYNVRRSGKRKPATLFFLEQWWRLVIIPRTAIERHFAWMKRYFGLKYFQSFTRMRVTQFECLTYIAALAVALAAERYQRPELHRSRSMVLANL